MQHNYLPETEKSYKQIIKSYFWAFGMKSEGKKRKREKIRENESYSIGNVFAKICI